LKGIFFSFVLLTLITNIVACSNEETVTREVYDELKVENEELEVENEALQDEIDELKEENSIDFDNDSKEEKEEEVFASVTLESIQDFVDELNSEMANEDVRYGYSESNLESTVTPIVNVTYYDDLEDIAIQSLKQIGSDAYEEDIEVMRELMFDLSELMLRKYGEGIVVNLWLESIDESAPLITIKNADTRLEYFDMYAEVLLEN